MYNKDIFVKNILFKIDNNNMLSMAECDELVKNYLFRPEEIIASKLNEYILSKVIVKIEDRYLAIYYFATNLGLILAKVEELIYTPKVIEQWTVKKELTR